MLIFLFSGLLAWHKLQIIVLSESGMMPAWSSLELPLLESNAGATFK